MTNHQNFLHQFSCSSKSAKVLSHQSFVLYGKFHEIVVFIVNILGFKIDNKHNLNNHNIQNYICVIIYSFEICESLM